MQLTKILLTLIFLGSSSYTDMRQREIYGLPVILFMTAEIVIHVTGGDMSFVQWLTGTAAGAVLFPISLLSGQGIGLGDCFILTALGGMLGAEEECAVFLLALLYAAVYAVLQIVKRAKRKSEFPFVPFLLAAYLTDLFLEYLPVRL